jgi:hypothetical protein
MVVGKGGLRCFGGDQGSLISGASRQWVGSGSYIRLSY